MAEESKPDISSHIEFIAMAARLAKVNLTEKQAEFMYRVTELLIEKGSSTTMKEIMDIKAETETDIKKRETEKKVATDIGRLKGGAKRSWLESNIQSVDNHNGKKH